jgi:hypothetical protein
MYTYIFIGIVYKTLGTLFYAIDYWSYNIIFMEDHAIHIQIGPVVLEM